MRAGKPSCWVPHSILPRTHRRTSSMHKGETVTIWGGLNIMSLQRVRGPYRAWGLQFEGLRGGGGGITTHNSMHTIWNHIRKKSWASSHYLLGLHLGFVFFQITISLYFNRAILALLFRGNPKVFLLWSWGIFLASWIQCFVCLGTLYHS